MASKLQRGKLITFEGVDGVGKTTQSLELQRYLTKEHGLPCVYLREPGSTDIGEQIRDILKGGYALSNTTRALLFNAARSELVEKEINPLLDSGKTVIMDRFYDSTTVYQGIVQKSEDLLRVVHGLNAIGSHGLVPDVTFILDAPAEVTVQRAGSQLDALDEGDVNVHRSRRKAFIALSAQSDRRFVVVNANQHEDLVALEIQSHIKPILQTIFSMV